MSVILKGDSTIHICQNETKIKNDDIEPLLLLHFRRSCEGRTYIFKRNPILFTLYSYSLDLLFIVKEHPNLYDTRARRQRKCDCYSDCFRLCEIFSPCRVSKSFTIRNWHCRGNMRACGKSNNISIKIHLPLSDYSTRSISFHCILLKVHPSGNRGNYPRLERPLRCHVRVSRPASLGI